jgi:peptide-methionine (R)-S-oxide reductase
MLFKKESAGAKEYPVRKSEEEWRRTLTPERYHVAREAGTERPFANEYWDFHGQGVYRCAACGNELFGSETKFDSGTGWPSFWRPIHDDAVEEHEDDSFFMRRTEVRCSRCGSHLGHVFTDGPPPTGLRYCMNSASLRFEEGERPAGQPSTDGREA